MRSIRLLTLLYFIIVVKAGIVNAQDKERLKDLLKVDSKSDSVHLQTRGIKGSEVEASFISGM